MDTFIGTIALFGFNFAPRGWAICQGQLLPINQYTALFSLIGTQFGGDGQTTFALPDLRGRFPVGAGQAPGLHGYFIGQAGGAESVTLTTAQMPTHNHSLNGSANPATKSSLSGAVLAQPGGVVSSTGDSVSVNEYAPAGAPVVADPSSIGIAGGNQPVTTLPPYLCLNYCICLEGIYPSRD